MGIAISSEDVKIISFFQDAAEPMNLRLKEIDPEYLKTIFLKEKSGFDFLILDMRAPTYEIASFLDMWAENRDTFGFMIVPVVREEQALLLMKKYRFKDFIMPSKNKDTVTAKLLALTADEKYTSDIIERSDLKINLDRYEVRVGGSPISLTYREFELLRHLVEHSGKAFSRDELLSKIWDYDYFGGSRTVDVHIQRLRAKLGPRIGLNIRTVRGVGYMYAEN